MSTRKLHQTRRPRRRSMIAGALLTALLAIALAASQASAEAPKAYVGLFKDNQVAVLDTESGRVVHRIAVPPGPHGLVITGDGRTVYVSSDGSSAVSVIDAATDRVARTIDVGQEPHGLALAPDGRVLLVAVNGTDRIAFVDTATAAVTGTVAVGKPHTIAIRPDGKVAYVASQVPGHFALAVIDVDTRAVVRTVALDRPPRDLEFGDGGKALYFTKAGTNAVQVLDPASDKIVAEIPTGASPHYANVFRGTTVGVIVVQGPGELMLFDPATNANVRSIAVGKQPHWITVSGDGKTAYVTNEGSDDLTIVDLASGKTTTVAVGGAPRKVVVQAGSDGRKASAETRVSIANFQFTPALVTIAPGESVTWNNDDGAPHAVKFEDGTPGSQSLAPGTTFRKVFDRPGSHAYVCAFHSYMTGRVVVQ
jgi:YVTN family beta-propeller protein